MEVSFREKLVFLARG